MLKYRARSGSECIAQSPMPRVKRGTIHVKRRENVLKRAKGFKWGRKSVWKRAKIAVVRAGMFSYVGRKEKKRTMSRLWNVRINAGARANGFSYSALIDKLHKAKVGLDRKVLAELAAQEPAVFTKIVESVK